MITRYTRVWLSALLLAALVAHVRASSGDRADMYQTCVLLCTKRVCADDAPHWSSLVSRLTRWTCADDCKYNCMHHLTDQALEQGTRVHQYYGKWPFWRFLGMQEPASVIFSIFNLLYHAKGYSEIRDRVPNGHPLKPYYIGFALVSINSWIWSAVFHTRDLPTTEKLDYFSAAASILFSFYATVIRLFHLYKDDRERLTRADPSTQIIRRLWTVLCLVIFIAHISYLTLLPSFDYSYNMAFNLAFGMSHNLLWFLYSLPPAAHLVKRFPTRPRSYRPSYAYKPAMLVLLTTGAMTFELLDFSPWFRVIDAHALWHLATVPIAALWYEFLIEDSLDDGWRAYHH